MSDATDTDSSRIDIRKQIREAIREHDNAPTPETVVASVAAAVPADPAAVERELNALEREGFVYCTAAGVRLP